MLPDQVEIINQQGLFYRNHFRGMLQVTYVLLAICFCLVIFIIYQFFTTPTRNYFATTINGQMIKIMPQ